MKRILLVALSLTLCVFVFGENAGPTKHKALSLDTSTTKVDIQAEFGTRAAQVQLVNDSDVILFMETNEVAFTGKEVPVKPGESLKVPIGDGDRERIDTVLAKAASGSSKAARLLVTLWQ